METRCPFAEWHPLGTGREPAMDAYDIICEHTAVTPTLGSLTRYFEKEGYSGVESHFGTSRNGRLYQFQSLDLVADANLDGNWHVWSIENADGYGEIWQDGEAVPGFTEAQIEMNIRLIAWLCSNGNIPKRIIPNSRRGHRGIAWHRMGVPGYMVDGGEKWSSTQGKVCPGDRKIAQIENEVIPRLSNGDVPDKVGGDSSDELDYHPNNINGVQELGEMDKGSGKGYIAHSQRRLKRAGYYQNGEVDGYFGPKTERAVRQFQRDHELTVDGLYGPKSRKAMRQKLNDGGGNNDQLTDKELLMAIPQLSRGDEGLPVQTLQGMLLGHRWDLGNYGPHNDGIDGKYGPTTEECVRGEQRRHNIEVDGIAGPQTYSVLLTPHEDIT